MRACKYLIALWTAAAVYALLSLLTGPMGFSAYRELISERDRQRANMEKLGLINETLENTKNSLLYDKDAISVYARELGYGEKDQLFVRIVGLGGVKRAALRPGETVRARRPEFVNDKTIKIAALSAGGAVFALFLFLDLFRRIPPF